MPPKVEAVQSYVQHRVLMEGPFSFVWYLGEWVTPQIVN